MCSSPTGKVVILDRDLGLLAWTQALGEPRAFKSKFATSVFASSGPGFDLLAFSKRSFAALLYARYKWFLAVVVAAILLVLAGRTSIWISRLYLVAAGVPSLDKISAMVLVLDRKGRIVYANANNLVRDIFGSGLRRRRRYDSTKPPAHPSAVDLIRRSFDQPFNPTQGQFEVTDGNGSRRIELVIYPRIDRRNQVLGKIVVGEDITGRVGWQRKAVLGDAAQRWIHKLKGHLATARIYIDNVLEREASGTEAIRSAGLREDLNAVKAEVEKTTEAAARILRFATIGRPNRIECDINEVISLAVRPYLDRPPKGVSVAKMLHPEPLPAFVDPDQIGEVLDNLLSNAVNALSTNGVVTVSSGPAGNLPRGDSRRMAEIVVEDDGHGISRDDLPQLFTPGFTKTPGGTGIGLAVVKEIVENHGGEVTVESESGKGSRFVVRIPG
jgi:signal transduction histidine kinase